MDFAIDALVGYFRNASMEQNMVSGITSRALQALQASKRPVSVNLPLPVDVVEVILSFVPAEDLLTNCIHVEQWVEIINSNSLWLLKCLRKWKNVVKPDPISPNFYRHFYHMPFGVNLLKNPCGRDGMNGWIVTNNGGDGWKVENPAGGADSIPDTDCQFCFTTSYVNCEKFQSVNLSDYKITAKMMDIVRPQIKVSEWHAARWDCGSIYKLKVAILDKNSVKLDHFEYEHTETQWTGRQWQKVEHVFKDYPVGVRTISFLHEGQDTQFWAGHYGSKMARASVKLFM